MCLVPVPTACCYVMPCFPETVGGPALFDCREGYIAALTTASTAARVSSASHSQGNREAVHGGCSTPCRDPAIHSKRTPYDIPASGPQNLPPLKVKMWQLRHTTCQEEVQSSAHGTATTVADCALFALQPLHLTVPGGHVVQPADSGVGWPSAGFSGEMATALDVVMLGCTPGALDMML
jgi:hypothetical protein